MKQKIKPVLMVILKLLPFLTVAYVGNRFSWLYRHISGTGIDRFNTCFRIGSPAVMKRILR